MHICLVGGLVIIPFAASLVTEMTRSYSSKENRSNAAGMKNGYISCRDEAKGNFWRNDVYTRKAFAHGAFFGSYTEVYSGASGNMSWKDWSTRSAPPHLFTLSYTNATFIN